MKNLSRIKSFGLFCCLAVAPANAFAEDWNFVVAPYALAPSISGDASIGRVEGADVDVDPGDVLETIEVGAMVQVEARHKSNVGILLNYAFMELGDGATGPKEFVNLDADIFQGVLEGYGTFRVEEAWSILDAYAGVRWWDISLDVDVETPVGSRSFDSDQDWVDPVIGVRWLPRIADGWRLFLQGDVGGFGMASDFSWNTQTGVMWDVSENMALVLQYRVLAVDYEDGYSGTADRFMFDTVTQGPLMGLAYKF